MRERKRYIEKGGWCEKKMDKPYTQTHCKLSDLLAFFFMSVVLKDNN